MPIDRAEVERIADLAQLELAGPSLETLRDQLQGILDHVAGLAELDLDDVPPTAQTPTSGQPLRPDLERPSLTQDAALDNAPDPAEGCFRVPQVLRREEAP